MRTVNAGQQSVGGLGVVSKALESDDTILRGSLDLHSDFLLDPDC